MLGPKMIGEEMSASDSLRVWLPCHSGSAVDALQQVRLRAEIESYGDIAHIEVQSFPQPSIVVTYYDIRAATAAKLALGEWCSYEPSYECRTVRFMAGQLEGIVLDNIAGMTASEDGGILVEFFDSRVAAHFAPMMLASTSVDEMDAATSYWEAAALDGNSSSSFSLATGFGEEEEGEVPALATSTDAKPRYLKDLRLHTVNWDDLSKGREWRRVLRLRGLPDKLCRPGALEALLKTSGLSEHVERVAVTKGNQKVGSALVKANSAEGVLAIAKFFHGRQLGVSFTPISVSFASNQGGAQRSPKNLKALHLAEPQHIDSPFASSDSTGPGSPRASEGSGVESEEGILSFPPGLEPPSFLVASCA